MRKNCRARPGNRLSPPAYVNELKPAVIADRDRTAARLSSLRDYVRCCQTRRDLSRVYQFRLNRRALMRFTEVTALRKGQRFRGGPDFNVNNERLSIFLSPK